MFQSLLRWIGLRSTLTVTYVWYATSAFQSLLRWIGLVNRDAPGRGRIGVFQSLLRWIGLVNPTRTIVSASLARSGFQSLLRWIGPVNLHRRTP